MGLILGRSDSTDPRADRIGWPMMGFIDLILVSCFLAMNFGLAMLSCLYSLWCQNAFTQDSPVHAMSNSSAYIHKCTVMSACMCEEFAKCLRADLLGRSQSGILSL